MITNIGTVPIPLWVLETLADSHSIETLFLDGLDYPWYYDLDRIVVNL